MYTVREKKFIFFYHGFILFYVYMYFLFHHTFPFIKSGSYTKLLFIAKSDV